MPQDGNGLHYVKVNSGDFSDSAVDRNLPASAGKNGLHPWSGKITHAVQQLSPCVITTEAVL